jgi:hypothetical protein
MKRDLKKIPPKGKSYGKTYSNLHQKVHVSAIASPPWKISQKKTPTTRNKINRKKYSAIIVPKCP